MKKTNITVSSTPLMDVILVEQQWVVFWKYYNIWFTNSPLEKIPQWRILQSSIFFNGEERRLFFKGEYNNGN